MVPYWNFDLFIADYEVWLTGSGVLPRTQYMVGFFIYIFIYLEYILLLIKFDVNVFVKSRPVFICGRYVSIKVRFSNKINIKVGFTSDCSLPIASSSATLLTHQMQWQVWHIFHPFGISTFIVISFLIDHINIIYPAIVLGSINDILGMRIILFIFMIT